MKNFHDSLEVPKRYTFSSSDDDIPEIVGLALPVEKLKKCDFISEITGLAETFGIKDDSAKETTLDCLNARLPDVLQTDSDKKIFNNFKRETNVCWNRKFFNVDNCLISNDIQVWKSKRTEETRDRRPDMFGLASHEQRLDSWCQRADSRKRKFAHLRGRYACQANLLNSCSSTTDMVEDGYRQDLVSNTVNGTDFFDAYKKRGYNHKPNSEGMQNRTILHVCDSLSKLASKYEGEGEGWRALGFRRASGILKSALLYDGLRKHIPNLSDFCNSKDLKKTKELDELRKFGLTPQNAKFLLHLPGIGKSVISTIIEILNEGQSTRIMRKTLDQDEIALEEFKDIWGVGHRTAQHICALGYKSLRSLREAAETELHNSKVIKNSKKFIKLNGRTKGLEKEKLPLTQVQQIGLKYVESFRVRIPRHEVAAISAFVRMLFICDGNTNANIGVMNSRVRDEVAHGSKISEGLVTAKNESPCGASSSYLSGPFGFLPDHSSALEEADSAVRIARDQMELQRLVDGYFIDGLGVEFECVVTCGSFRRGNETCGDIDLLFITKTPHEYTLLAKIVSILHDVGLLVDDLQMKIRDIKDYSEQMSTIITANKSLGVIHPGTLGENKSDFIPRKYEDLNLSVQAYFGVCVWPPSPWAKRPQQTACSSVHCPRLARRIDIKIYPREYAACAILYFTGSAHFNRSMRAWAGKIGFHLDDRALVAVAQTPHTSRKRDRYRCVSKCRKTDFRRRIGVFICKREEDVFDALGLIYVRPSLRDGQVEAKNEEIANG